MTEQEKSSAVVEETREAVETTAQPVNTEKKGNNSTALILSAVAIAIALAAGVGLYGWGKQQATTQTATSDALANQLTALQKAQESQKAELKASLDSRQRSLMKPLASKPRWSNSLMKYSKKSPLSPAAMLGHGCWRRLIFW